MKWQYLKQTYDRSIRGNLFMKSRPVVLRMCIVVRLKEIRHVSLSLFEHRCVLLAKHIRQYNMLYCMYTSQYCITNCNNPLPYQRTSQDLQVPQCLYRLRHNHILERFSFVDVQALQSVQDEGTLKSIKLRNKITRYDKKYGCMVYIILQHGY